MWIATSLKRRAPSLNRVRPGNEDGIAVMVALIALSLFSLIGLYMALNSTTELRVSDNYESRVQANYAAQAGLQHGRELLKGRGR